jgi:hypothetical protein
MVSASDWNSLEIAKLIVSALTPILLFALTYMVTRAAASPRTYRACSEPEGEGILMQQRKPGALK